MKIFNWLYSHQRQTAIFVFLVFLIFYASSIPSFNAGYADSDELLAVAWNWGLAHPPGYSLYVSLLHLFMHFPLPLTTAAFRAHLISAISSALALAISYLILHFLYRQLYSKRQQQPHIFLLSSLTTIAVVGTSLQFWLYSQITEKYLFAAPFVACAIYLSLKVIMRKFSPTTLFFLGVVLGIAIGHHQSLVFLLPFWLYTLYRSSPKTKLKLKNFLYSAAGLLISLLFSVLLLFFQISRQASKPVSWYAGDGWQGVFNMLTRQDFNQKYGTNLDFSGYLPSSFSLTRFLTDAANYFQLVVQSAGWWIILPIAITPIILWTKRKSLLVSILLPFIFIGPFLAGYLTWPADIGTQAITQRFYLISFLTLIPLIFVGLSVIFSRLEKAINILALPYQLNLVILAFLPIFVVIRAIHYYPQVSLKDFDLTSTLYQQILVSVEPNSLISCYSDTSCFALLYEQTVNHLRPDVQILPLAYPLVYTQIQQKNLARFTYPHNPFLVWSIVTDNIDKRPVYVVDLDYNYFNFYGIPNGFTFLIPTGYASKLTHTIPQEITLTNDDISQKYTTKSLPTFDKYRQFLVYLHAQTHIANAYTFLKQGDRQTAQQQLNLAGRLSYQLIPELANAIQAARLQMEQTSYDSIYLPGSQVISPEKLLTAAQDYLSKGKISIAYNLLLGAITIDPDNISARLELAKLYQQTNNYQFAIQELNNVLVIDPQNPQAQSLLEKPF